LTIITSAIIWIWR